MSAVRFLPAWNDAMSDGCSVPQFLREFLPLESDAGQAACRRHDEKYYYGGSREDRFQADLEFAMALLLTTERHKAEQYFYAVRSGGGPGLRIAGVSWSFGGGHFRYSDAPALPDPEAQP